LGRIQETNNYERYRVISPDYNDSEFGEGLKEW
jgi:hypothetical protein